MAKQPGRRGSVRSHSLRKAGYALLAVGLVVVAVALLATTTRIGAASNGLMLIGGPLMLLGGVLMGLDWMSSYTAATEGSWDHHVTPSRFLAARAGPARSGERDTRRRRRSRGLHLFGRRHQASAFANSVAEMPFSEPAPQETLPNPPRPVPAPRPPRVEPITSQATGSPDAVAIAPTPAAQAAAVAAAAPVAVVAAAPAASSSVLLPSPPKLPPEPVDEPEVSYRSDPGPDTVIEEFVGYEGQDRMLAPRESASQAPRELAWPNPPRKAADVSADGAGAFLEKLMDELLAKMGTHEAPAPAVLAPPTPSWSPQTLHNADHWRFAALVEKLYQQAGFATQLQASQTMRGVVVLWLFSRHQPGMPASVVRCVHAPGQALSAGEILSVAELVKERGLPRGQLATTATVNAASQQLASAQQVHLMDTQRLLDLISRRTVEQQRVLAARLA